MITLRILPVLLAATIFGACARSEPGTRLVLAATTSIEDTGLLDVLVSEFTSAHPDIELSALAVGTGQAIELGRQRDADVLMTHDSTAEMQLVQAGIALERRSVMHNYFIIAGPAADPARARGRDALASLRSIAEKRALFISRGDDSGTHRKERILWSEIGVEPDTAPGEWYMEAGVGMGDALVLASQKQGYILSDRGTYLRFAKRLRLTVICDEDTRLLNSYGVTVIDGQRAAAAKKLADWITSPAGQRIIRDFGQAEFGQSLFTPSNPL